MCLKKLCKFVNFSGWVGARERRLSADQGQGQAKDIADSRCNPSSFRALLEGKKY